MNSSPSPVQLLQRFLSLILKDNRSFVWTILFYGLLISLMSLAVPISVQALVNNVAFTALDQPLLVITALLLVVLLGSGVFQILQMWLIDLFHRKIFASLGSKVSSRLFLAKSSLFEKKHAPELVNRFFDVFTVQKSVSMLLTDGFSLVLQLVVGLTLIAFYHPFLLIYDVLLILGLVITWLTFGPRAMETATKESKAKYGFVNWLEEQGRNYRVLSSYNAEKMVLEKSESLIEAYVHSRSKHFGYLLSQNIMLVLLYAISSSALLGLGGYLVIQGQLSLGQLVAAEIIITSILAKLAKSGKYLELFYDLVAASEKILDLFNFETVTSEKSFETKSEVTLHFQNIFIEYKKRTFQLNEKIPFRSRVFFNVHHAACKEIVIDKLFGEAKTVKGNVFINERMSESMKVQEIRSTVYTVGFPKIFEGTIRENLLLGDQNVSDEEIHQVLELVELAEVIEALEDKYEARMLPEGFPLWESQLIRFDIARALLLKPKVIIVNETFQSVGMDRQKTILSYLTSDKRKWSFLQFGGHPLEGIEFDRCISLEWKK